MKNIALSTLFLLLSFKSVTTFGANKSLPTVKCDLQVSQVWADGSYSYSTPSSIEISENYRFLYESSSKWKVTEKGIEISPNINNFNIQLRVVEKDSKNFLEVSFVIVKFDFPNNIKTKNLYRLGKHNFDIFLEHTFGPERASFYYKSHQTSLDDFFEGDLENKNNPGILLTGTCQPIKKSRVSDVLERIKKMILKTSKT